MVGREAILHDRRLGKAHVINASAARIWEMCDGRDREAIVRSFADLYQRAPDDVRADVDRVLGSFVELDLLG